MNATFSKIARTFMGISRNPRSTGRARRLNRVSIGLGIEGLEGRVAPGTVLVGVTVTNLPPTESPAPTPAPVTASIQSASPMLTA